MPFRTLIRDRYFERWGFDAVDAAKLRAGSPRNQTPSEFAKLRIAGDMRIAFGLGNMVRARKTAANAGSKFVVRWWVKISRRV